MAIVTRSPEKFEPGYVPQDVPTGDHVPAEFQLPEEMDVNVQAAAETGDIFTVTSASMTSMNAAALRMK